MNTDSDWEEWGRRDPYFGVITHPRFRRGQMTAQDRRDFFESGQQHADYVLQMIRRYIDPAFQPTRFLDFGCGVGRTLIPFAKAGTESVGVDVSPSMLAEARSNLDELVPGNTVKLVQSDDSLSSLDGRFDLIHSFIVFQHIPPQRGWELFRALLAFLRPAGVAAIHFAYSKAGYANSRGVSPQQETEASPRPVGSAPVGGAETQPDPEMQMNPYAMNEILFLIQGCGATRVHAEFTDHGGELGVFLFFQRPSEG